MKPTITFILIGFLCLFLSGCKTVKEYIEEQEAEETALTTEDSSDEEEPIDYADYIAPEETEENPAQILALYRWKADLPQEFINELDYIDVELLPQIAPYVYDEGIRVRMHIEEDGTIDFTYNHIGKKLHGYYAQGYAYVDGYAPCAVWGFVAADGPGKLNFHPRIPVDKAVHYIGSIIDIHTNQPIPNMGIYSNTGGKQLGRSDANGNFEFWAQAGPTNWITVWGPDYVGQTFAQAHDKAGTTQQLIFYKERGVKFKVRVIDEEGAPIAGADVRWYRSGMSSGKTDTTGMFTANNPASAIRPANIRVSAEGYETYSVDTLYASHYTEAPLVVTLKKKGE